MSTFFDKCSQTKDEPARWTKPAPNRHPSRPLATMTLTKPKKIVLNMVKAHQGKTRSKGLQLMAPPKFLIGLQADPRLMSTYDGDAFQEFANYHNLPHKNEYGYQFSLGGKFFPVIRDYGRLVNLDEAQAASAPGSHYISIVAEEPHHYSDDDDEQQQTARTDMSIVFSRKDDDEGDTGRTTVCAIETKTNITFDANVAAAITQLAESRLNVSVSVEDEDILLVHLLADPEDYPDFTLDAVSAILETAAYAEAAKIEYQFLTGGSQWFAAGLRRIGHHFQVEFSAAYPSKTDTEEMSLLEAVLGLTHDALLTKKILLPASSGS